MTLAINQGTPVRTKPFPAWPICDEREEQALARVLRSGEWWHANAGSPDYCVSPDTHHPSEVCQFGVEFARAHDSHYGFPATNGTATLELILRVLDIGPGDEVIVPAYTYIATASCVLTVGAVPIFVDIVPGTSNLDPACLADALSPRTRAIIPVHFGGQAADMDAINAFAKKHGLAVIEDAAHAHGASWQGTRCGALADLASFSFQASKNLNAGEGGIITTNNPDYARLCYSYIWGGREQGRPWYEHHRLSGNYRLSEFQAAILRVQLTRLDNQTATRDANGRHLAARLQAESKSLTPMTIDPRADRISFHLFLTTYDPQACGGLTRADFLAALAAEGIPCSAGYGYGLYMNPCFVNHTFWKHGFPCVPPYGQDIDYPAFAERCPATEATCKNAIWFAQNLLLGTTDDVDDIVEAILKIEASA